MSAAFWIVLALVVLLVAGWAVISFTWWLLGIVIGGLVVGALGRLLVPGTRGFGLGTTILVGVAGSILGGLVGRLLTLGGIVQFLLGVLAAALLVGIVNASRTGPQRPR